MRRGEARVPRGPWIAPFAPTSRLAEVAEHTGEAGDRLEAVLSGDAMTGQRRGHEGSELAAVLHRGEHVDGAQQPIRSMIAELLAEASATGIVRGDVAADELIWSGASAWWPGYRR